MKYKTSPWTKTFHKSKQNETITDRVNDITFMGLYVSVCVLSLFLSVSFYIYMREKWFMYIYIRGTPNIHHTVTRLLINPALFASMVGLLLVSKPSFLVTVYS